MTASRRFAPWKTIRGTLLALTLMIGGGGLAAMAGPTGATAAPPSPSTTCNLGNGVKHVISLVFDNVHFSRDNPNVPSDLEQMPHLLSPEKQRHGVLQLAHADHRPHGRRQPLDLHRPVRRPPRPAVEATPTRPTTPTAQPIRPGRSPTGPRRSTTPQHHRRARPTTRRRRWPTRPRCRPGLRRERSSRRPPHGSRSPGPAARSVTSRPPTWCWRTPSVDLSSAFGPSSPEVAQLNADP